MSKTMLTDLYQLTMLASYFDNDKDDVATFDLFIRKLPEDWGYYIANGIEDAIDYATNIEFTEDDIDYLRSQDLFNEDFLAFLSDFKFQGDIYVVKEGTPVFPNEPVIRVTANRTQEQFLETALLNIVNYQTMITTKANRVVNSADGSSVIDFGLRRAQGEDAAMKGARAAYIGGAVATSNVKAGMFYNIPISGTQAHSYVMSFPTEIDAFRAYVNTFPDNSILLIDTYKTLQGARNAAIVAKEMEQRSEKLKAVRLDSGDLCTLSKRVRAILNEKGLDYVKIVASNDLNEYKIDDLIRNGAQIDGYGVGTELITAKPVAAIPGVYKLVEDIDGPKMKLSPGKVTHPGVKQVYRIKHEGKYLQDILTLEGEIIDGEPLLEQVVLGGNRISKRRDLNEIRQYSLDCVTKLPDDVKNIRPTRKYDVEISYGLENLMDELSWKNLDKNPMIKFVRGGNVR